MIALAKPRNDSVSAATAPTFEELLPSLERQVLRAFLRIPSNDREDMVAEAIAESYCAYARLVARGKADLAFATPLSQFSVRRIRYGRRVGNSINIYDISSRYCQRVLRISVEQLDLYEKYRKEWKEVLIEDRKAGPAETATARIDLFGLAEIAPAQIGADCHDAGHLGINRRRRAEVRRKLGRDQSAPPGLEDAWRSFQGETAVA